MASNIVMGPQEHYYKFKIKIKDFTRELGEVGKSLDYKFSIGETGKEMDWILRVYPKGDQTDYQNFMSVHLHSLSNVPVQVYYKISLVDSSGNEIDEIGTDRLFQPNHGYGWHKFISREELFDKKNKLLNDDTLTLSVEVKCEIKTKYILEKPWFHNSLRIKSILENRSFADVTIKVKEKSLKAHKLLLAEASPVLYLKLLHENQDVLELDNLEFGIVEKMVSFLYNNKIKDIEKHVGPLLEAAALYKVDRLRKYCEKYLKDHLTVDNVIETLILANKNELGMLKEDCLDLIGKNIKNIVQQTYWRESIFKFPDLFSKIFSYCVNLMQKNLSIYYVAPKAVQTPGDPLIPPMLKITEDLESLFIDKCYADVELKVEEKVLKVHKAILTSRSEVFRAMFEHDTLEAEKNEVVIKGFDFETIQELVRFMYCQKVLDLDDVALNLLPAADKYGILDLKELCTKSLEKNLTVENVLECWKLADMHNCPGLKEKAIAYLGSNVLKVIETPEWQEFIKENLILVNEMFLEWINKFC